MKHIRDRERERWGSWGCSLVDGPVYVGKSRHAAVDSFASAHALTLGAEDQQAVVDVQVYYGPEWGTEEPRTPGGSRMCVVLKWERVTRHKLQFKREEGVWEWSLSPAIR